MAAAAIRAKFSVVNVIGAMTTSAGVRGSPHRCQRTAMTGIAGNIDVRAANGEAGLSVVIEQPQIPGNRVVTGLAVFFEFTVVRVILEVTANACRFRSGEHLGLVTGLAILVVVFPKQWECGQVMIEPRCFFPGCLRVTVLALVTLPAIVHFIFKMAGGAIHTGGGVENRCDMTIDTFDRLVRAVQ